MVRRALLRKERSKETQFEYGGQKWTLEQALSRASRSKKPIEELANTPEGMVVTTPDNPNDAVPPGNHDDDDEEEFPRSPSVTAIGSDTLPAARGLPLSYNGKTRQDLADILKVARASAQQKDAAKAEQAYIDVFRGLEHLLSPTAVDTVKIGYEIASFYWEQGRKADADGMLETMSATHIKELGMHNRSTQQHILHVVEMLNSWKRGEDALVMLQHARDIEEIERDARPRRRNRAQNMATSSLSVDEKLQSLYTEVDSAVNSTPIDEGLVNARIFMGTNHPTIEVLLKAIERQCLDGPSGMVAQGLRARAELLKHYISKGGRLSAADKHAFETAGDRLKIFWRRTRWDKKQFQSHEVIEASLELAAGVLRGKLVQHARWMFGEIEKKATDVFGADDERTIWTLINIGIIYQTYRTWEEARRWFETALAASLAAWGTSDGVTRALENARDNRHFAYLNDEGRPFETIFGVCGITIRPTRLHLE
ncbi:uncharacterized protein CC84DRAFT_961683 [Paraphaeosphaeria sporulosa]|uniref:TPR-like protein n=1 Tax=Paraphaeosphaeria sporulosa TaxID=1460663 RepID=A0A177C8J5_9PLEO|nr:uncharacterized protein CC84DRAFT_961683 [Paraphaeosphaeria sporulosa]OAG03182.1 hypothetical protein CC84DRAFT_961683 [Paraphaeosphaeria sporulosa]